MFFSRLKVPTMGSMLRAHAHARTHTDGREGNEGLD